MNPLFFPTLLLTALLFWAGVKLARRSQSVWLVVLGVLASLPAVAFASYYTKLLGEPLWLYWFRSQPFTELTAAGLGLLAGWLQFQRQRYPRFKKSVSAFFIPFLLTLAVAAPYLKQIVLRPDWSQYEDRWNQEVCLQSSESSCGPASAATLLRQAGINVTERELAQESFTTRRGTENWYLLRTIRRHGVDAHYVVAAPGIDHIQHPAIAGVRLKDSGGAGHFIAVLDEENDRLLLADPLVGLRRIPRQMLPEYYDFTGFYLVFSRPAPAK